MKHSLGPEQRVFTLDDIRILLKKRWRLLLCAALMGGSFSFLAVLREPPVYKVQATFKEGAERTGIEYSMRDLLLSGLKGVAEPEALALMKTYQVMKPVIEKHGLQIKVLRPTLSNWLRRLQGHVLSQFGLPLPEADWFEFEAVRYEGEQTAQLFLRFTDQEQFAVFDQRGQKLADGLIGKPVILPNATFTCSKIPSQIFLGFSYRLRLSAWVNAAEKFKKNLKIAKQNQCQSIYDLTLHCSDRFLGPKIVNDLMRQYRVYLKRDRDEVAVDQLAYLEQKQEEICKRFETLFDDHAAYLACAMKEKGWIGLEQEMRSYLGPYEELCAKALAIDLELERLQRADSPYKEGFLAAELGSVLQQIKGLEHERGVLLKSLPASDLLAQGMSLPGKEVFPWLSEAAPQWEGIDLDSARALYAEYATKLDAAQSLQASFRQFKDKLEQSEFDMSSLSCVLQDSLSQSLIAKGSLLSSQLREVQYSSEKERERWKEELVLQKASLLEHLEQMGQVQAVNAEMMQDKIASLQKICLSGIERQMSVLQQQIQEAVFHRTVQLQDEKKILQQKMQQLRSYAADLPERWKLETWLQLKTDMGKKIMTAMAELVESKTIGRHLHHIESKPLDLAEAPLIPHRSLLFPLAIAGAFCSAFAVFWAVFLKALLRGFPLTARTLKALGLPFAGEIGDMQTLRRIGLFFEEDPGCKVIALLGEKGPNYSYRLAQNLHTAGKRICIVDCDFSGQSFEEHEEAGSGLLQWLQGEPEELPVRPGVVDRIAAGGFSSFGCELIQSKRFQKGLQQLKSIYDYIFLWQTSAIDGVDAKVLLNHSERAVVSFVTIQTEQLTPLLDWAYHEGKNRITFISFSG